MGCEGRAKRRDPVSAGAGADAGLHRRPGGRRPGGDARRDGGDRRRPGGDQSARRRRPGDRSLGAGGRVRERARLRDQCRARLRAQPRALLVPQVGPGVLRQVPGRPARDRHLPPGQPRVHRPGRLPRRQRGGAARLPRHAGRDRLPHDDGQRPRRARLGSRRDRGGGGDAGPADLDAAAAGARLQALRRAARGSHRHRPRPHRDRDAPRAGRGLDVRGVLRRRALHPRARRPGDDRKHVAGVRLHLRDLSDRRGDPALPGVHRPPDRGDRAGRRLRPRAGDVPRRELRGADLLRHPGARPRRRRAEPGRAEAPSGPGAAGECQGRLPGGDEGARPRRRRGAQPPRRGDRPVVPCLGPARRRSLRRTRQTAPGAGRGRRRDREA